MMNTFRRQQLRLRGHAAFTLIELLAVMAIILVLAGLILNIAGSAQYNSAKARATGEIKAFETALESYKSDNGGYPPDPYGSTDATQPVSSTLLNPQSDFDPTNAKYLHNSQYLYQVLSGFPVNVSGMALPASTTTTMSKAYFTFTVQQLHVVNTGDTVTTNSPNMYIIDPFGFSYGYSTIYAATAAYNSATAASGSTPAAVTVGYNPTFDLWSTAGYAPGGKSTPSTTTGTTPAAVYNSLWVKNW